MRLAGERGEVGGHRHIAEVGVAGPGIGILGGVVALRINSDMMFSHGICPDCLQGVMQELDQARKNVHQQK